MKVLFIFTMIMFTVVLLGMTAAFIYWWGGQERVNVDRDEPHSDSDMQFAPPDFVIVGDEELGADDQQGYEPTEPEPTPEPEPEHTPPPAYVIDYFATGGLLELPVIGASGYAAVSVVIRANPQANAENLLTLSPGEGFTILGEDGAWWHIEAGDVRGWVPHRYCLINLPDVIPSIVYDITNAYASLKRSSGYDIPNISGQILYEAYGFNPRFGRYEFIVPVMYSTAIKLAAAQRAALEDGRTIIVYEAFRPRMTQISAATGMQTLMNENAAVAAHVNTPPWSLGWFIATSLSNHQRGAAVDVSLSRVVSYQRRSTGDFSYLLITEHERYEMPTAMHELSPDAAIFRNPVSTTSPTAWIGVPLLPSVTEGVVLMQGYLSDAGFTPISSEWWHFNDLEGIAVARSIGSRGEFYVSTVFSVAPTLQ
ncbi:MAG: SH3 domain-containing protein [Oscillospiraceae bacterium]|nr:SH3 domain-containing protein [Oscillospiraceae bacterium]MCL2277963.1 SH3 domain-containing protein [Oscillospiraceae bacterium]